MTKTVRSGIAALFAAFLTSSPVFAAPHVYTPYSVVPIFFVPNNWKLSDAEVQKEATALQAAMKNVQQFYRTELGGATFVLDQMQVVRGNLPKEGYGITWGSGDIYAPGTISVNPSFEHLVATELKDRGFPVTPDQTGNGFIATIFVKGIGGEQRGRMYGRGDGGWLMLGDWTIDGIQRQVNGTKYPLLRRAPQLGKTAQMLAGAFGVPHPAVADQATTIVHNWPGYRSVGLNQHDVDYLVASKSNYFRCSANSCLNARSTGLPSLAEVTSLTQAVPEPATVVSMLAGMMIALKRFCLPVRLRAAFTEYLGKQRKSFATATVGGLD